MIRMKRKAEDWRSARFFQEYEIEERAGKEYFVSRTACDRKGRLDHEENNYGMSPACHTYPNKDLDIEEV